MQRHLSFILCLFIAVLLSACGSRKPDPSAAPNDVMRPNYPLVMLPLDFDMRNEDAVDSWRQRTLPAVVRDKLGAAVTGRLRIYAVGRVERPNGPDLYLTFVDGDQPEVLLSTHDERGMRKGQLIISRDATNGSMGYGTRIDSNEKIYRSEMMYVRDERSGAMRPEVDHDEVWRIADDGSIYRDRR